MNNNLSPQNIEYLRNTVTNLVTSPIIQLQNGLFSINECDGFDCSCVDIGLEAEATIMTLDAIEARQTGLIPAEILGAGNFNTVRKSRTISGRNVALKPCDLHKMVSNRAAFFQKDAQQQKILIGGSTGTYRRNKATKVVQDMMMRVGAPKVMTEVSAGTMRQPDGSQKACMVMDFLGGTTIHREVFPGLAANNGVIKHTIPMTNEFIRHETWIQLEDILTGQIDRHSGNVMYNSGTPVGVDHDMSFPSSYVRPGLTSVIPGIIDDNGQNPWSVPGIRFRNFCMPPVIDKTMYDAIKSIDLKNLESKYRACGLTRFEISAAMRRAEMLQIAADRVQVIAPEAWATSRWVQQLCKRSNFYAFKHAEK
jgi:hypothetical protein